MTVRFGKVDEKKVAICGVRWEAISVRSHSTVFVSKTARAHGREHVIDM